ncbi:MAG: hypothetical protein NZ578_10890 [Candidatus Binatia bacterium]|nr:hypothetical protein [Candidatus Binatia bacterium]
MGQHGEPGREHARLRRWVYLLLFLSLGGWGQPCAAGWLSDSWSRFDRYLATFDPAGRFVRQPIEKRIPALTFKGFYRQWSDILLTGNQQIGFRDKDFRFLQLQHLLEIEMHYQFSPHVELTNVNHFLYDGAYNWQHAAGLYAPRRTETMRVYHNFDRIVRELYLSYRTHSFDVVLGKQQIAWGKMDGRFIDVINAMDVREGVQLEASDFEYRRLPAWMANLTYFFGANSLNFLWIPNFEQDRNPVFGSPWFSPRLPPADTVVRANEAILRGRANAAGDTILRRKRPSAGDWGDHEYGVRLDVSMEPLTWGLIYYYAWNKNPTNFVVGRAVEDGATRLLVRPRHTRLHHFGLTADYATAFSGVPLVGELPIVLRVEGLWTKDVRFADFARIQAARSGDLNGGHVTRDTLRAAIAVEFAFPGNTAVILQPSLLYTFHWRETLGSGFGGAVGDEWNLIPVFFIERPFRFTRDRLRVSFTATPFLSGPTRDWQGVKTKLIASYNFSQFITGRIIYTAYSSGDRTDIYGQYDKWDNVGWEVSYEF